MHRPAFLLAVALTMAPLAASAQDLRITPTPAARAEQLDKRIAALHARLKIAPAQEPLWAPFAQVMRDNAGQLDALEPAGTATLTAPETLSRYARSLRIHADEIGNLVGTFQALYDSMDPTQRRVADDAIRAYERTARRRGG